MLGFTSLVAFQRLPPLTLPAIGRQRLETPYLLDAMRDRDRERDILPNVSAPGRTGVWYVKVFFLEGAIDKEPGGVYD